jgi:hypothetical protein
MSKEDWKMGPMSIVTGLIIITLIIVLVSALLWGIGETASLIVGLAITALLIIWSVGGSRGWVPAIAPVNYHIDSEDQNWTQILPDNCNIKNEKKSKVLYLDRLHLSRANQFVMGWGRPKSKEPKFVIWGIIERKKGKIDSQTLKFYVVRNFWFWKAWQYLGEEKLTMKTLPPEGRRMFSAESKFGKKLKKFFIEELKLEEKDFFKSIPVITPFEPLE